MHLARDGSTWKYDFYLNKRRRVSPVATTRVAREYVSLASDTLAARDGIKQSTDTLLRIRFNNDMLSMTQQPRSKLVHRKQTEHSTPVTTIQTWFKRGSNARDALKKMGNSAFQKGSPRDSRGNIRNIQYTCMYVRRPTHRHLLSCSAQTAEIAAARLHNRTKTLRKGNACTQQSLIQVD